MTASARPTAVLAAVCCILQPEFDIVATATDGMQALAAVISFHPELLVLDIAMPGWSGFETAQRTLQTSSTTKILFLTIYEDIDYIEKARELGASYVFKRRMRNDLLAAALGTLAAKPFFTDLLQKRPK